MIVKNKEIKLSFINDARIILFGIAALMVTFFHTYELDYLKLIDIPLLAELVNFIKRIGSCGVDIFLFLSGIGLYLSMSKNKIGKFYKNRFIRIIPKYLVILIIYSLFLEEFTYINVIERLFGISFFTEGVRDGWYIAFIMLLYLLFPLIYKIFKKYDVFALFCSTMFFVIFNVLLSIFLPDLYFRWEVGLTRIPVFLIGTYFGKKIYEGSKISIKMIKYSFVVHLLILIILYLNVDLKHFAVFSRYLYCPLAICSVINVAWLYSFIKNKNMLILKPINFIGNCSLEMYLLYEKTCYILLVCFSMKSYIEIYLLAFLISLLISYVLNKLFNIIKI